MSKKKKILLFVALLVVYLSINLFFIGNEHFKLIKNKISFEKKKIIKNYLFPYSFIQDLKGNVQAERDHKFYYMGFIYYHDFAIKKSLESLELQLSKKINLDELNFEIYSFVKNKIARGVNLPEPGTGYLDFYDDKLFFTSSIGIVSYSVIHDQNIIFKQIENNIENFIGENQLRKNIWFSIKDFKIIKDKVFVTFTNEVKEDCWNTSVIYADLNFEYLDFKKFLYLQTVIAQLIQKMVSLMLINQEAEFLNLLIII